MAMIAGKTPSQKASLLSPLLQIGVEGNIVDNIMMRIKHDTYIESLRVISNLP